VNAIIFILILGLRGRGDRHEQQPTKKDAPIQLWISSLEFYRDKLSRERYPQMKV
jgi:hypothetical protein